MLEKEFEGEVEGIWRRSVEAGYFTKTEDVRCFVGPRLLVRYHFKKRLGIDEGPVKLMRCASHSGGI